MHSLFYFSFFVEWRWTFHKFIASSWILSHLKGQTRFSPATVWHHTHTRGIRNINVGLINDTRWNYSISVSVLIFSSTGLKLTAAVVWHVFHISRGPTRAKYVICIRNLPACLHWKMNLIPARQNSPSSTNSAGIPFRNDESWRHVPVTLPGCLVPSTEVSSAEEEATCNI